MIKVNRISKPPSILIDTVATLQNLQTIIDRFTAQSGGPIPEPARAERKKKLKWWEAIGISRSAFYKLKDANFFTGIYQLPKSPKEITPEFAASIRERFSRKSVTSPSDFFTIHEILEDVKMEAPNAMLCCVNLLIDLGIIKATLGNKNITGSEKVFFIKADDTDLIIDYLTNWKKAGERFPKDAFYPIHLLCCLSQIHRKVFEERKIPVPSDLSEEKLRKLVHEGKLPVVHKEGKESRFYNVHLATILEVLAVQQKILEIPEAHRFKGGKTAEWLSLNYDTLSNRIQAKLIEPTAETPYSQSSIQCYGVKINCFKGFESLWVMDGRQVEKAVTAKELFRSRGLISLNDAAEILSITPKYLSKLAADTTGAQEKKHSFLLTYFGHHIYTVSFNKRRYFRKADIERAAEARRSV